MENPRNPGVRILAAVAVVMAHGYVLVALLVHHMPAASISWDDSNFLVLIDAYVEEPPQPPSVSLDPPVFGSKAVDEAPPEIGAAGLIDPLPPIDWSSAGERAAAMVGAGAGAGEGVRGFGVVARRGTVPRKAKPFAWDKTHTQRVEGLPEGGTRVRLSARCEMILAPLPMVGCSVGKVAARGDLFVEMSAPVVPGDWQDIAATLKER